MKKKPAIAFKGSVATLSVLNVTLRSNDIEILRGELATLCGGTPDFFNEDPAIVDAAQLPGQGVGFDWAALVGLLRAARLNPLAVRHAAAEAEAAIRAAGLNRAEAIESAPRKTADEPAAVPTPAPPEPPASETPPPAPSPPPTTPPAPPPAPRQAELELAAAPVAAPMATTSSRPAMVVDRPLRSGQQVYARHADLIVLAMVNPGAEVMADGNIHVYAPLRGRALAGAAGDTSARIFTTCFEAELVSVGGLYRPLEPGMPREVGGKPAQVRLVDGEAGKQSLRIEALAIV